MQKNSKYASIWSLYTAFLFVVFNQFTDSKTAAINTATIVVIQLIVYFLNLKWILPLFYELKKYWAYALSNVILILLGLLISSTTTNYTTIHNGHLSLDKHHDSDLFHVELFLINALPIVLVIFISFFLYASHRQKQQEEHALALATAEKNFLIQQINPHFLFNALNNIYFLTYKNSPKGSKAIMQLSKMLDYSLYGEKQGHVTLKDEIAYINNFIELFKLKDSKINNITFDYLSADSKQTIAPLLLIPFIENAFKHGNIENTEDSFIAIRLSSQKDSITFSCQNSFDPKKKVDNTKGIGIKNVSRRLVLLYPKKHTLTFEKTDHQFSVHLKIAAYV